MNRARTPDKFDQQIAEISEYLQRIGQEMIVRRNGQIVFRPSRRLWLMRVRDFPAAAARFALIKPSF